VETLVGSFGSADFEKLLQLIQKQPTIQDGGEEAIESTKTTPTLSSKRRRLSTANHIPTDHSRQTLTPVERPLVNFLENSKDLCDSSDAMGSIKFGDEQDALFFGP
jgi:hypothetical protein